MLLVLIITLIILERENGHCTTAVAPQSPSPPPFDAVTFFGDLNYRVDLHRLEIELAHRKLLLKNVKMKKNEEEESSSGDDGEE